MMNNRPSPDEVARKLAAFYNQPFGGKPTGRYRISPKNLRRLMQRRRISDKFVRQLSEEMFELGFIFVDLESYFAVISARSLNNYRRVSDSMIDL